MGSQGGSWTLLAITTGNRRPSRRKLLNPTPCFGRVTATFSVSIKTLASETRATVGELRQTLPMPHCLERPRAGWLLPGGGNASVIQHVCFHATSPTENLSPGFPSFPTS
jgi:hypothetical protein